MTWPYDMLVDFLDAFKWIGRGDGRCVMVTDDEMESGPANFIVSVRKLCAAQIVAMLSN